ncbi:MAG: flagellar filament protein FlaA [Spirochaetales bacterium]|nr:flagellar filament protein FlaA [Spirochaetales bacterium]
MKEARLLWGLTLLLAWNSAPIWADQVSQRLESITIDTFNDPNQRVWNIDGKEYKENRIWVARGSKFASKIGDIQYPRLTYVPAWPQALFYNNPDHLNIQSLGINGRFDREGYNFIELYPANPNKKDSYGNPVPAPIQLPGIVKRIDLWVWGSNYRYTLEIHLRDADGIPYVLNVGSLDFAGWKNLQVNVPSYIPQVQRYLPEYKGLTLTDMVVRTDPTERVSNFYVYFKELNILTDMQQTPFDGRDLAQPSVVAKYWSTNQQGK